MEEKEGETRRKKTKIHAKIMIRWFNYSIQLAASHPWEYGTVRGFCRDILFCTKKSTKNHLHLSGDSGKCHLEQDTKKLGYKENLVQRKERNNKELMIWSLVEVKSCRILVYFLAWSDPIRVDSGPPQKWGHTMSVRLVRTWQEKSHPANKSNLVEYDVTSNSRRIRFEEG